MATKDVSGVSWLFDPASLTRLSRELRTGLTVGWLKGQPSTTVRDLPTAVHARGLMFTRRFRYALWAGVR